MFSTKQISFFPLFLQLLIWEISQTNVVTQPCVCFQKPWTVAVDARSSQSKQKNVVATGVVPGTPSSATHLARGTTVCVVEGRGNLENP